MKAGARLRGGHAGGQSMETQMKNTLVFLMLVSMFLCLSCPANDEERVEEMRGKRILILSPHPDDDTFCCGGIMALFAKNGNDVRVALYTNDDKGSFDLEMDSQRLARIRKAEEEAAVEALGIPKKNVIWMGYHDGELEYVPQRELVERTAFLIRQFRPDVLLAVEPGEWYERWHKSDHRMAAFAAIDGVRAAEFHLYFPNHRYPSSWRGASGTTAHRTRC
jgi:LmbE family N-acetylglucosaminyl deacetylase